MNDLFLKKSDIQGVGLFSNKYLAENEVIIKRCINVSTHEISYFGKYVNHSYTPNTDDFQDYTVTNRLIKAGEEITTDYRQFDAGWGNEDWHK